MKNFRTNTAVATTPTAPVTGGRPVGLCSGVLYLK